MALVEINWRPAGRELRQFAMLFVVFFGALGAYLHFKQDVSLAVCGIIWGVAAVVGLVGLTVPPAVRPVYVLMMLLALPIGAIVSFMLLVLIYYAVVTPIGLLMRLVGYDPMGRQFDASATTYWVKRTPAASVKRYFRQY